MKVLIAAVLISAITPAAASAQYYNPYSSYQPPRQQQPYSTYDRQSGNRYQVTPNYDGSTTVRGSNMQNGSTWRSTIQPNGNQRGTDSNGNYWNYNSSTGSYYNSNGTVCYGRGAARACY